MPDRGADGSRAARLAAISRAADPARWEEDRHVDAGGGGGDGGGGGGDGAGGGGDGGGWDDGWDGAASGVDASRADTARWRERVAGAVRDRVPPTVQAARWSLDPRAALVVCVVAAVALAVAVLLLGRSPRPQPIVTPTFDVTAPAVAGPGPVAGPLPTDGPSVTATVPGVLVVDVAGLVARPGVYELPHGSRVIDAIDAAGGAVEGTDLTQLNLARPLVDGEQVAVGVPAAPVPAAGSPTGASPGGAGGAAGPIDLNAATEADLDALPGVGPVLAARIVAWRTEHGRFSSVEELLEVSGIGDAIFADIAPLVSV